MDAANIETRLRARKPWDNWTRLVARQAAQTNIALVSDVDRAAFSRAAAPIYDRFERGSPLAQSVERIRATT